MLAAENRQKYKAARERAAMSKSRFDAGKSNPTLQGVASYFEDKQVTATC